jgi:hypothetical protein
MSTRNTTSTLTIADQVRQQRQQWSAQWCWAPITTRLWNTYVYFRRRVELPGSPRRAVVRVSADARYILFVNGQRVHQGPARSYPDHQSFDTLDVTDLFRSGANVIAAVAHQFGAPTFQHVFRDASGFLLDAAIECEGSGDPIEIHTPAGWLCRPARGWRQITERCSLQLGFQEHFDADADAPDWMSDSFEAKAEDGWIEPRTIGPVGTHPWLLMEPRGVPLLADHVEPFTGIVAQFGGENPRGYKVVDDVYHLVNADDFKKESDALTDAGAMLRDDVDATTVSPPPEGRFVAATLDLRTYRTGHLILDIADAGGDEIVDVLFAEALEKSQLPLLAPKGKASHEATALRYRCRPGEQRWESFHFIGMRYVLVIFRNVENKPLKVRRIAVRQVHAALGSVGSFHSSDDRLNQIWTVGRHTQLNCAFDAFVDCPWREQAMWWGDAHVQGQVTAHAFGDISLLERGIRLVARSQTSDGALHAHPPADVPRHRLPDFMMTWVGTLWDHYFCTGRTELLRECLPTMQRLFDFFHARENEQGLIGSFEGFWTFIDWADVYKADYSAALNLAYLQSLRQASEIARLAGESSSAAEYAERAEKLTQSVGQHYWNAKTNSWRDGVAAVGGEPIEQTSQHVNAMAILLGLKPETHAAIAKNVLLKSANAKRTKIVTASPFFYAYVLEALAAAGLRAEAIGTIRDKWGAFIDDGATTFPELWKVTQESRCHAWSASPVYHLMRLILGVRQTEAGWRRARIEPCPETLDFARGVVPTPLGPLRVDWEKAGEDQLAVRVDVPEGIAATFVSPTGEPRELDAGGQEFHT